MRRCVAGVMTLLVGAGLAACSSDADTESSAAATSSAADVCASADALRASLTTLADVQVVEQGTDAVQQAWTTVQDDWAQLAQDAGDQYADQVDRVEADGGALQSAIETTQEDASAEAVRQVAAAVRVFVQDAGALTDEVKSTC
jgi:flagellin-like hook-associated protein FlgL